VAHGFRNVAALPFLVQLVPDAVDRQAVVQQALDEAPDALFALLPVYLFNLKSDRA